MRANAWKPAFVLAAAVAATAPAAAQQVCAPRDRIIERLGEKYGESRHGFGLQGAKVVVELYASAETGTWTIIATRPDGTACALAAGQDWREGERTPPPGPPA